MVCVKTNQIIFTMNLRKLNSASLFSFGAIWKEFSVDHFVLGQFPKWKENTEQDLSRLVPI